VNNIILSLSLSLSLMKPELTRFSCWFGLICVVSEFTLKFDVLIMLDNNLTFILIAQFRSLQQHNFDNNPLKFPPSHLDEEKKEFFEVHNDLNNHWIKVLLTLLIPD
jgi:hypothetical protein